MTDNEQKALDLSEVMKVVGLLYRRATRSLERDGTQLTVGTRSVLEFLTQTAPQPVPRIAETLQLSRQFVQRSVDGGIEAGVFELVDNPTHQRSKLVHATSAGRELMARTIEREQQLLLAGARSLTADETATCLRVLRTVYTQTTWNQAS